LATLDTIVNWKHTVGEESGVITLYYRPNFLAPSFEPDVKWNLLAREEIAVSICDGKLAGPCNGRRERKITITW